MDKPEKSKQYDLEGRTLQFAKDIRSYVKSLKKTITNMDDCRQLIRSSGSIGANYIEANEALSKKDFLMRVKIARKEAKEAEFWLRLIEVENKDHNVTKDELTQEAKELLMILSAIINKSS